MRSSNYITMYDLGEGFLYTTGRVVDAQRIGQRFCRLKLRLGRDLGEVSPFQFIMAGLPGEFEIPLTVSMYNREKLILDLFFKVREYSTEKLCGSVKYISLRGFYGKNRLNLVIGDKVLYITEDLGFSSLPLLISWIKKNSKVLDVIMVFENESEIFEVAKLIDMDFGGRIVQCIRSDLEERLELITKSTTSNTWKTILAAGGRELLKKACELAYELGAEGVIAPYTRIKCGIGACGYCIIPRTKYLLCVDGPIFKCSELASYLGLEHGD